MAVQVSEVMATGAPEVRLEGDRAIWTSRVRGSTTDDLWFSVPASAHDMLSPVADPALLGLLLPAMRQGRDLQVDGRVSTDLYSALDLVQHVVCRTYPEYRRIHVECSELDDATYRSPGVGMGFSGGVDSFAALVRHHLDPDPGVRRLTHLLFNNVGSHGSSPGSTALFQKRLARVQRATGTLGLPLIDLDSNLDEHFRLDEAYTRTAFLQTGFMRNAAAAHVLASGIGTWLYSASTSLDPVGIHPSPDSAEMEPLALPLLSSARLTARITGLEPRVAKTLAVADLPADLRPFLDVCIHEVDGPPINCSQCEKCMRTMLTLEIVGGLGRFTPQVFRPWRVRQRAAYMAEVLAAPSEPYEAEMIAEAALRGWVWPRRSIMRGQALRRSRGAMAWARRTRAAITPRT
ncbi:hypothetical protein SAMN06296429_104155 [Janibacter indicus]|uniref:7-cyano-7-deazaguanine synthase (Queuosine biosynthesis) n=2 Tax=Janibacter indicus TaxID=857417 RepID=A0A1W1ZQ82_9MICO|nr:hypothetical protein SAMN06296429_104155 [Janibacter indicus]